MKQFTNSSEANGMADNYAEMLDKFDVLEYIDNTDTMLTVSAVEKSSDKCFHILIERKQDCIIQLIVGMFEETTGTELRAEFNVSPSSSDSAEAISIITNAVSDFTNRLKSGAGTRLY